LVAQSRRVEVSAGLAVPIEILGTHRSAGPLLRLSLPAGSSSRVARARFDVEAMLMPGTPAPSRSAEATGDVRSVGAMANLVIGPPRPRVAPYVILGAGLHALNIAGAPPVSYVGGVRAGLGIRIATARFQFSLESAAHLNLSERATGQNFRPGSFVPISVGIAF